MTCSQLHKAGKGLDGRMCPKCGNSGTEITEMDDTERRFMCAGYIDVNWKTGDTEIVQGCGFEWGEPFPIVDLSLEPNL